MQIDVAQWDVSCSPKGRSCKHNGPECEGKQEERFSTSLIYDQCVNPSPSLIHYCRCKDPKLIIQPEYLLLTLS